MGKIVLVHAVQKDIKHFSLFTDMNDVLMMMMTKLVMDEKSDQ